MKHYFELEEADEPKKKYNPNSEHDLLEFIKNYRGTRIFKTAQKFGFDQESIKKHLYANQRLGK